MIASAVCKYVCVYVCMYMYVCTYMYVCMYMHVHIYVCVCVFLVIIASYPGHVGIRLRLEIVGKINTYMSDIFPYH